VTKDRAEALRKAGHRHVIRLNGDCIICDRVEEKDGDD